MPSHTSGETAEDAFHAFVVARTPALSRTAYLLTGDAHLAEDLVQTALFKAAKSWHRIEGDLRWFCRCPEVDDRHAAGHASMLRQLERHRGQAEQAGGYQGGDAGEESGHASDRGRSGAKDRVYGGHGRAGRLHDAARENTKGLTSPPSP